LCAALQEISRVIQVEQKKSNLQICIYFFNLPSVLFKNLYSK